MFSFKLVWHSIHRKFPAGKSKRILPADDELKSTWEHKCITGGTLLLLAALLGEGILEIESIRDALGGVGAALFAYYLSGATCFTEYILHVQN